MKRKLTEQLIRWKEIGKGRLPLLIYGARQVGKTYMIREFGDEYFKNTVYVNFEREERLIPYFEMDLSPERIISVLEDYFHVRIIPGQTLIIFDEIQICERALTSMKYFAESAPEFHLVAAGSLLGVAVNREHYSFPVGKVKILTMYPMDFEEFLWAGGKELLARTIREHFEMNQVLPDLLHQEALMEYRQYLISGGMPAVVLSHFNGDVPFTELEMKELILAAYTADMAKYASRSESAKISEAYDSLPTQLGRDNKKFQYKLIRSGARGSLYGDSIDWLICSGIVLKCTKCEQGHMPPSAYLDLSSFKLYYSDIGLLAARSKMTLNALERTESELFTGALTENYVAQALKASGYELNYWESKNTAEVDFLIVKDGKVIPIECKAGTHVKAKSLMVYQARYQPEYCIRISTRNFGFVSGIQSVPVYAVFCI